jgi:glucose-6-phosphate isomerase
MNHSLFTHDIDAALAQVDASTELAAARTALETLRQHMQDASWPVLTLPGRTDDLAEIEDAARRIRGSAKHLLILGMGASTLGGEVFADFARDPFRLPACQLHFIDNIDPDTFDRLLDSLAWQETHVLAISKSGGTAETLAQFLILQRHAAEHLSQGALQAHFTVITQLGASPLRRMAEAANLPILLHDPAIGGRFAALTCVGLLPAAVAGLDIRRIRAGALTATQAAFAENSAPVRAAALQAALYRGGKTICVLMPYIDRLSAFGRWHQQLWAESLGKSGYGTTAIRAIGAVDQHSQLQLYLDGPRDKFFTFLLLDRAGAGASIPGSGEESLAYLRDRTIGDLMGAEQRATVEVLAGNGAPCRVMTLSAMNEETLGALMMHFMLETMIMAGIWGIDAFDQPAVEQGKVRARAYLARAE